MITSIEEYNSLLQHIQSNNRPTIVDKLPSSEKIFNIDLESRVVEAPEALCIQHDHNAETIYFCVDRYFDHIDLSQTVCVIQYLNAKGQGGLYFVPFYDLTTYYHEGKMLLPWMLEKFLTQYNGRVYFSVRFYRVDEDYSGDNVKFLYNLNTQVAASKVVPGGALPEDFLELNDKYDFEASVVAEMKQQIANIDRRTDLYWTVLN